MSPIAMFAKGIFFVGMWGLGNFVEKQKMKTMLIIWALCAVVVVARRVLTRRVWEWNVLVALATAPVVCLLAASYGAYDWGTSEQGRETLREVWKKITEE